MIPLSIYYYSVKALKNGYWSHKSQIIVFNLSLEEIEYWIAVEYYEEQQTSLFNGCSWKKP